MQALVLNQGLNYRTDISKPEPKADEALIRLSLAGICATDLELVKGYAGFNGIIGHEFVGVVEAVADTQNQHWLNRRVVGSINIGCHACAACRNDEPEHCRQRKVLGIRQHDGVFADYLTLPVANLFAVPDGVNDQTAVFAEPLAAALRVREQLHHLRFHKLAVLGPGKLGLLIAKVLALAGHAVDVLGRTERALALPRQWQLSTSLVQAIGDSGYDCVVDATGQVSGFQQALRILKPRGNLILKSTFSASEAIDLSKIVVNELNIIGSRCGPFAESLALLDQQLIPLESLIDASYPLSAGLAAMQHAAVPGVRKILLHP